MRIGAAISRDEPANALPEEPVVAWIRLGDERDFAGERWELGLVSPEHGDFGGHLPEAHEVRLALGENEATKILGVHEERRELNGLGDVVPFLTFEGTLLEPSRCVRGCHPRLHEAQVFESDVRELVSG